MCVRLCEGGCEGGCVYRLCISSTNVGYNVSSSPPPLFSSLLLCLVEDLDDDKSRKLAAAAYGAFTGTLPGEDVKGILLDTVLGGADGIDEFAR